MQGTAILIVDGNLASLKLAWSSLSSRGYEVRTAVDADEALRVLKNFAPRLILLEIALPGTDGLELARRVRADSGTRDIRIVAFAARKSEEESAIAAGCDGFAPKPIDRKNLAAQVEGFLQARS